MSGFNGKIISRKYIKERNIISFGILLISELIFYKKVHSNVGCLTSQKLHDFSPKNENH